MLDDQATEHIFQNSKLLTNHRKLDIPICFTGVNREDGGLRVTDCDDFGEWTQVPFHPQAAGNIISFSRSVDDGVIISSHHDMDEDAKVAVTPHATYRFLRNGGLYAMQVSSAEAFVETVSQNIRHFTQRQVDDAKKALDISRRLGYPDTNSLLRLFASGTNDSGVAPQDLRRAYQIFGPELAKIKGKTKASPQTAARVNLDLDISHVVDQFQTLSVDLFFVNKQVFFLSVSQPMDLAMVTCLGLSKGARSLDPVRNALKTHIAEYRSRDFVVEPEPRYNLRNRNRAPPSHLEDYILHTVNHISVKKAIQLYGSDAMASISSELQQMLDKNGGSVAIKMERFVDEILTDYTS
eukprot:gene34317-biopygen8329